MCFIKETRGARKYSVPARPFIPAFTLPEAGKQLAFLVTLLWRADARHRAANEPTYDQETTTHECGTPACAVGHLDHAYATPRRVGNGNLFEGCIGYLGWRRLMVIGADGPGSGSLYVHEYTEIFGSTGCGQAKTAREAAAYIQGFIARKWGVYVQP